ncbi:MAG: TetR/AcrR family transcriptional regulator [Nannocystaceae bacterium]
MSRSNRAALRKAIVDTSIAIGTEHGESGLTMRGIASRLGVSATALYQHFESKAAILREIRVHCSKLLQAEVLETCRAIENPRKRLEAMGYQYVDFARRRPWLYSVLAEAKLMDWSELTSDEIAETLRPLTTVRSWVSEGVEKNCWDHRVDPEMSSMRMWVALHGLSSLIFTGRISESHPVMPIDDQDSFIRSFVANVVDALG